LKQKPKKRSISAKLRNIKFLLLDIDGVMTDGGIYYSDSGDEFKKFNIQDGYGIVKLQRAGINAGIITGRISEAVKRRAAELNISEVHQNLERKSDTYEFIKIKFNLLDKDIAYIGDDEFDLPVLERVGFSAAPADAVPSVRKKVDYVCEKKGGEGAVREVIEIMLKNRK
jgi:3-deoxy-D-manno-octulosonate 8-phosphate phosphatase (KDO 8-P phosphatase)